MSNYKKLRNAVKRKCASEDFKEVNKCIDDIISNENDNDKIKIFKSLICQFEGNLNQANYYSLMAVFYAIIIGGISVISDMITSFTDLNDYTLAKINLNMFRVLFIFIFLIGLAVFNIGQRTTIRDYKNTFILRVLYFKLDEINRQSASSIETYTTNETVATNGVNTTSEAVKTKNYREYVVRVYDK